MKFSIVSVAAAHATLPGHKHHTRNLALRNLSCGQLQGALLENMCTGATKRVFDVSSATRVLSAPDNYNNDCCRDQSAEEREWDEKMSKIEIDPENPTESLRRGLAEVGASPSLTEQIAQRFVASTGTNSSPRVTRRALADETEAAHCLLPVGIQAELGDEALDETRALFVEAGVLDCSEGNSACRLRVNQPLPLLFCRSGRVVSMKPWDNTSQPAAAFAAEEDQDKYLYCASAAADEDEATTALDVMQLGVADGRVLATRRAPAKDFQFGCVAAATDATAPAVPEMQLLVARSVILQRILDTLEVEEEVANEDCQTGKGAEDIKVERVELFRFQDAADNSGVYWKHEREGEEPVTGHVASDEAGNIFTQVADFTKEKTGSWWASLKNFFSTSS